MVNIKTFSLTYWRDKNGATSIEYGLIAAVIAISLIAAASNIGANSDSLWQGVTDEVDKV